MRYGVAVPNFGKFASQENILEFGQTAEKLGFDSLWVSDHVALPKGHKGFGNIFYDPLVTLSYLASNTEKIMLGTSVLVLPYRNPVVLAKQLSTLDVLSDGRLILGIGSGWLKEEFDALGVNFNDRGAITDEYIEIIKALLSGERINFKGKYYSFKDVDFYPKAFNNRIPDIWVGGSSINSLERAVKFGNGWHAVGSTPYEIKKKITKIKGLNKLVISVRKNLQITRKEIKDDREVLRGSLEKIKNGIEDYKKSGVSYIVFQILGNGIKDIIKTMNDFKEKLDYS